MRCSVAAPWKDCDWPLPIPSRESCLVETASRAAFLIAIFSPHPCQGEGKKTSLLAWGWHSPSPKNQRPKSPPKKTLHPWLFCWSRRLKTFCFAKKHNTTQPCPKQQELLCIENLYSHVYLLNRNLQPSSFQYVTTKCHMQYLGTCLFSQLGCIHKSECSKQNNYLFRIFNLQVGWKRFVSF